jgi:hypothetical protein
MRIKNYNLPNIAIITAHKAAISKPIVDPGSFDLSRTASVAVTFASFLLRTYLASS